MSLQTFLLEIGTEELPADFVRSALAQWQARIPLALEAASLTPSKVEVFGTPRRLAVLITGLPHQQPDREEDIKGPPVTTAYKAGQPTPALLGFAKKQGIDLADLEIRPTDKGEFVFVRRQIPGKPAQELLPDQALEWLQGLEGRRFMRWSDGDFRFPRPIRWLLALLDGDVLPLSLTNGSHTLASDRTSRGHRILHPEPVSLVKAEDYTLALRSAAVIVDPEERRQIILEQIQAQAQHLGGTAEIYPDLLDEVVQLVEFPTAVIGQFEAEFLRLPKEVITTVMVTHQRYFPIYDAQGQLLPHFITIANGDPQKADLIAEGNARVIRARLADANFFFQADCDEPLDSYLPQLETVTFQEELGTMRDKVDRIMNLAQAIAEQLDLNEDQRAEVESTAMLCKADLVTQMVYEFPELQGVMGQKYALVSGESEQVALGIFEHYLPRNQEDPLPQSLTGQVVGLSDRLDTLVSIFGLGLLPTGSSDPFALRRAANAVINITWAADLPLNLDQLLQQGSQDFVTGHDNRTSPLEALRQFFMQRLQALLEDEQGLDYDLVKAVLGDNDPDYRQRALTDLLDVRDRAHFLQQIRNNGQLEQIYATVNRSSRLAVKGNLATTQLDPVPVIQPALFEKASEKAVYQALLALLPKTQAAQSNRDYQQLVDALAEIAPTVAEFFDGPDSVLVMAEAEAVRQNRLNLLGLLRNHARILADFGAIVKG
ncbi:glycine--tRNA ligase subunit beta [Synechocystis sp. LKSZ1]|uniref:glycine--tRNA ligase subunit beta n=1 Tax=Synechocystis sp. LKSZ1 TaxID=3144951 RepID=UPI00336BD238